MQMSCWHSCCTQLRQIQSLLGKSSIEVRESLARGLLPHWEEMIWFRKVCQARYKMRLREMKIDRYSSLDEWQKQARSNIKMAKANDA